jgi:K+ transporter
MGLYNQLNQTWQTSYALRFLLIFSLIEICLFLANIYAGKTVFDVGLFVTIPGFIIAIVQLTRTETVQRSSLIKDLLSQIYLNNEISSAFHDLVRTYDDARFQAIDKIVKEKGLIERKKNNIYKCEPIFDEFEHLQMGRQEPCRFYHPELFMGSQEERRIDMLLGYFDLIGYYYHLKLVKMSEIYNTIGYQLSFILARKALSSMIFNANYEWWKNEPNFQTANASTPFVYLKILLDDFQTYGEVHKIKISEASEEYARRLKIKNANH